MIVAGIGACDDHDKDTMMLNDDRNVYSKYTYIARKDASSTGMHVRIIS